MADKQNKGAAAGAAKDGPSAGKKGEESKKEESKTGLAEEELVSSSPINIANTYTLYYANCRLKKTSNLKRNLNFSSNV